jgi:hypothetical protein
MKRDAVTRPKPGATKLPKRVTYSAPNAIHMSERERIAIGDEPTHPFQTDKSI